VSVTLVLNVDSKCTPFTKATLKELQLSQQQAALDYHEAGHQGHLSSQHWMHCWLAQTDQNTGADTPGTRHQAIMPLQYSYLVPYGHMAICSRASIEQPTALASATCAAVPSQPVPRTQRRTSSPCTTPNPSSIHHAHTHHTHTVMYTTLAPEHCTASQPLTTKQPSHCLPPPPPPSHPHTTSRSYSSATHLQQPSHPIMPNMVVKPCSTLDMKVGAAPRPACTSPSCPATSSPLPHPQYPAFMIGPSSPLQ
jgi:hypothetical protein